MDRARSRPPAMTRSARAPAAAHPRTARPKAWRPYLLWREPLHVAEQVAELALMEPALHLRGGAHAETPQLDEAGGRRLVERIPLAVGRQGQLVQLRRALPADHARRTLEQLEPHLARDVLLGLGDEGVQRVAQRAEPEPVVHHLRPML